MKHNNLFQSYTFNKVPKHSCKFTMAVGNQFLLLTQTVKFLLLPNMLKLVQKR